MLVITVATGWFVAQEFAVMSVDRARLGAAAAAGDEGAVRALEVTGRTSFVLSGAQLGITVTGLLVGYVAEPLIGSALGDLLGGIGTPTAVGIAVGTALALAFSTLVQMVFGELVPQYLAIARPEPVARRPARSTTVYLGLAGWLIAVFDATPNALLRVLRVLRIEPVHDVEHAASRRDLEQIVADSEASGDLAPELSLLLDRVLDFPTRDVEHAMVPASPVDAVAAGQPVGQVRRRMVTGHSRYPVLADDGQVVGVVQLRDVLGWGGGAPTGTAGDLARPAARAAGGRGRRVRRVRRHPSRSRTSPRRWSERSPTSTTRRVGLSTRPSACWALTCPTATTRPSPACSSPCTGACPGSATRSSSPSWPSQPTCSPRPSPRPPCSRWSLSSGTCRRGCACAWPCPGGVP